MGFAASLVCVQDPALIYDLRARVDDIHVVSFRFGIGDEVRADMNMRVLVVAGNKYVFSLFDDVVFKEIVRCGPFSNLIDSAHGKNPLS
jgi:hypothetical protein